MNRSIEVIGEMFYLSVVFLALGLSLGYVTQENTLDYLPRITGTIASAAIIWFGFIALINAKNRSHLFTTAIVSMMVANISYTLELFPDGIIDILYDISTILILVILYKLSLCPKSFCIKIKGGSCVITNTD